MILLATRALHAARPAPRSMVWCGMVWYGMVWYGMVWYGMVWYGMVWYGMVWYGMVWYGMVWYGMVWYGMVNGASCGVRRMATATRHTRQMNRQKMNTPPLPPGHHRHTSVATWPPPTHSMQHAASCMADNSHTPRSVALSFNRSAGRVQPASCRVVN